MTKENEAASDFRNGRDLNAPGSPYGSVAWGVKFRARQEWLDNATDEEIEAEIHRQLLANQKPVPPGPPKRVRKPPAKSELCGATNESLDNGAPCKYLAGHLGVNIPHTTANGIWWYSEAEDEDDKTCHCGQPVTYGFDGHPNHHRGMCKDCDPVRCDVDPEACKTTNGVAKLDYSNVPLQTDEVSLAELRKLLEFEPLIVSAVRKDLERSPQERGGELRFLPSAPGYGASGCPGDNLTDWLDQLSGLLELLEEKAKESE